MRTFHDYESMGYVRFDNQLPPIIEAFKGSDIVDWHGRIEQSLVNLRKDAEKANNFTYKNRLDAFLETWRQYPIDGSLNRETIEALMTAALQWAREEWDLQSYFLSLHTRLRQLIASEEELPRDIDMDQNPMPSGGGGHGGAGGPPLTPSFGPEEENPDEEGAPPEGAPGEAGAVPGSDQAGNPEDAEGEGAGGNEEIEPEEIPQL